MRSVSKLAALMRQPSDRVVNGLSNFPRPPIFQGPPNVTKMREQVLLISRFLREENVEVEFRYDGEHLDDGTFVFDHAAFFSTRSGLFAFVPTATWPRLNELELSLGWIQKRAHVLQLCSTPMADGDVIKRVKVRHSDGEDCRFDPGTIVQAPNGVLVGWSRHVDARTNYFGAVGVQKLLEDLGYEGKVQLVEYSGLHLSTFCTCISTKEMPRPAFLVSPEWVDQEAVGKLGKVIPVSAADAWRANSITHPLMNRVLLMDRYDGSANDELDLHLREMGYDTYVIPFTESQRVQGSPFCHALLGPAA